MIDQGQFYEQLTRTLTPLTFRKSVEEGNGSPDGDISTWYNTPCATVAAACSTAVQGSDLTAQAPSDIRHAAWGRTRLPSGPCPDENTLFQACSISKAFQSLAILHFHSEGSVSFGQRVIILGHVSLT